jgi:hypothetical protein
MARDDRRRAQGRSTRARTPRHQHRRGPRADLQGRDQVAEVVQGLQRAPEGYVAAGRPRVPLGVLPDDDRPRPSRARRPRAARPVEGVRGRRREPRPHDVPEPAGRLAPRVRRDAAARQRHHHEHRRGAPARHRGDPRHRGVDGGERGLHPVGRGVRDAHPERVQGGDDHDRLRGAPRRLRVRPRGVHPRSSSASASASSRTPRTWSATARRSPPASSPASASA